MMLLAIVTWLAAAAAAPNPASLVVTLDGVRSADVTLQRWDEHDHAAEVARSRAAGRAEFHGLAGGSYRVLARGEGPLAVAGVKLTLVSGERRRVTIAVHPATLDGRASFAGKPLAATKLSFTNVALHWRAEVVTDGAGHFTAELWQPGAAIVTASGGVLAASYSDTAELRGGRFDFAVPDRQVRGRIVDAASGRGVPQAAVSLRSSHGEIESNPRTLTDADGNFLFNAVAPGAQHLTVLAIDYVIPEPVDFTTKEGDPTHRVDVALDSGAPRALRVLLSDGRPAASVELDAVIDGAVRAVTYTDTAGRASVPLPRSGEAKIYVLPRDGSFAIVGARDAGRVVLPPPSSSLRIVTRSTDGAPLPGVELLMAFNGAVVPPAVAHRLDVLQGLSLMTNGEGEAVLQKVPAGWYQFWPYRGEDEAAAIMASSPVEAPIALNVKTGENAVMVEFQARAADRRR
jgi:hypothetical protein